jgi:AcrR family transcriptional regulator
MNRAETAEETDVRKSTLAAALRLFAAHGYDATPIQAVADAVGVSKQAVLHHFSTKEQLRAAVLDSLLSHWNETLPRLLLAASASEDRFEAVFGELFRFFTEDRDRARVLLREALDRPEEVRALLRGPVRPWAGMVAQYIEAGQEHRQHFPDVDAEAYVIHILQLVLTAASSYPVSGGLLGQESRKRYDRELARIARASLFLPAPPARARVPIAERERTQSPARLRGSKKPRR